MKKNSHFPGRKKYLALAIPLLMAAQAQGVEFNVGQIEGSFDSQISMGSSWRVENQDDGITTSVSGLPSNSDDGDRNYKNGDAFSQIIKGSHDLQFSYQNFGGFVRGKYWYDSALDNNAVEYGHTPTTGTNGVAGAGLDYTNASTTLDDSEFDDLSKAKGATVLDAFVYASFELGEMPLDIRLGRQVVSWGEGTFIRGGVNAINPVDINAFVRPGAEIKEGLLPVNMAFANIGLTENLSMEAFYQLEFQETVVPGCGTYFSTNDTLAPGCNSISAAGGMAIVPRNADGVDKASDDGQFGLAFRYISEALGDTEFGFYAMNIHSRAPVPVGNTTDMEQADRTQLYINVLTAVLNGGGSQEYAQQQAGGALVLSTAPTANYAIAYPEDQVISGISFATNVGSVALSGEVSHSMDIPVQINGVDSTRTLLGLPTSSTALTALSQQADIDVDGFRLFDISQAQVTAIKFFDQVAGASRIAVVGEVGYTYIHSFDESDDAIKFGRSDVYGESLGTSADDGFTTESSWGYRLRVVGDYSDVFGGVNLKPTIAWSDDVKGYSNPGGNFQEGQQSLGLSVQATYLETYNATIAYTQYMGGDYSIISDRDFASMSIGIQF